MLNVIYKLNKVFCALRNRETEVVLYKWTMSDLELFKITFHDNII